MGLLRSPLDALLGSQTKVKLLRVLLPLTRPLSLREAARLAGISPAGALRALDDLTAVGVVERRQASSQSLYTVARDSYLHPVLSALFDAEEARMQALFDVLRAALRARAKAAAVFGSRARGDDRPDSDLDLLVVVERGEDEDALAEHLVDLQPKVQREFGLRVSPVILTAERLRERAAQGDPFVEEVAREGITVLKPTILQLIHGTARAA